jgi:hypothetical protein
LAGPANQSDDILASASRSLKRVQMGPPIGMKSRELRRKHLIDKLTRTAIAGVVLLVGASVAGAVIDGIGFWGVMITGVVGAAAAYLLMRYPNMPMPTPETLRQTDLATLAGKTEIWLEAQRPALPAPAFAIVQDIGKRLDALSPQLQTLGENDPAAREVRKLVGEHLPELINGYKRIPEPLRRQDNSGKTPEAQLVDGLKVIDREIATMTGQISRGELDKLATRDRYLETRYDGEGVAQ